MSKLVLCGTGHRPKDCVVGKLAAYSKAQELALFHTAKDALASIQDTLEYVISGGAQGWDKAVAQAAYSLGIPYHVYIPFRGQERMWPAAAQASYTKMLSLAQEVVVCGNQPLLAFMQIRNEAMVDASDIVLALHNGKHSGGTWNCLLYAAEQKIDSRPDLFILNQWSEYVKRS